MATISAVESITLDGVMQAPGGADEDTRDGFTHGGWAAPFADRVAGEYMAQGMGGDGALLFGRRTYERLLGYWTTAPEPNPFREVLVGTRKYVVSRKADTELEHPRSTLLAGDAAETVGALAAELGGALTILGSGELVRALARAGLVDEYILSIHPLLLGTGMTLFERGGRADLHLEESLATTTGVVIARYTVR